MNWVLTVALFTVLSGLGDACGFLHAGRVWQGERFDGSAALKSAGGFLFGVAMYWLALKQLTAHGIVAVEIQTIFWFGATIIGVALLSGQVLRWPLLDQLIATCVLGGIGWLMLRTAS
jgi:hypothetical protein